MRCRQPTRKRGARIGSVLVAILLIGASAAACGDDTDDPLEGSGASEVVSVEEATEVTDALMQTFISRDYEETARLLGPGGAWIEIDGEEFFADTVAEAFAAYEATNMVRVWRDEDPYPAADGGFGFVFREEYGPGSFFTFFIRTFNAEDGSLRFALLRSAAPAA